MYEGMFRGMDKVLYGCMTFIVIGAIALGFLLGRCT